MSGSHDTLNTQVESSARGRDMISPALSRGLAAFHAVRYGPHESVPTPEIAATHAADKLAARPGDFILTHSAGVYGRFIRFGEGLRYWGQEKIFAHWNHAAIFGDESGNIIEALGGGVQKRHISVYHGTEYVVVHLPAVTSVADRQQAVEFAEFCLKDPYGWLTIASISLFLLTGAKFSFGVDGQQICSALVARSLERIGEIFTENEPWHIMPADLAKHFGVRLVGEPGQIPPSDFGVILASRPGRRRAAVRL
jgi:uncharacterized protein YycO